MTVKIYLLWWLVIMSGFVLDGIIKKHKEDERNN
tara:strand:- start:44 stop:145 length:102 start_codon:yes stop_codon:yes gene_type:complete